MKIALCYAPSEQQFIPVPPLGIAVLKSYLKSILFTKTKSYKQADRVCLCLLRNPLYIRDIFEEYGLKILLKIHPVTYGFYSHWILLQ